MTERPLERANRAILRAIEAPPDTGCERRLDAIAGNVASLLDDDRPDPGRIARLRAQVDELARRAHEPRASELRAARHHLADATPEQAVP